MAVLERQQLLSKVWGPEVGWMVSVALEQSQQSHIRMKEFTNVHDDSQMFEEQMFCSNSIGPWVWKTEIG